MPKQLDLIDDAGLTIKPQAGSNEPRLWVHRLVIWKNPGEVLRQIELRPGFNIVWSPDPAEQDEGSQRGAEALGHGSPREADLGLSLYHRLFLCIRKLETLVSPVLFQYILTTTTRPPAELAQKPWLIETLRGAPAGERLLRQDL